MFRVELTRTRRRARTWVLAALLVVPVAVAVGVFGSELVDAGGRTATQIGTAASPAAILPFLGLLAVAALPLPAAGAIMGGSAFGSDMADGTLRYLLIRPVGRVRLYMVKFGVVVLFAVGAALLVALVGVAAALAAYGPGELRPLALTTGAGGVATGLVDIGFGDWIVRLVVSTAYVALLGVAVGAVALAVGMRSESTAVGAAVAVLALVVSAGLSALDWLGPVRVVLLGNWVTTWTTVFTDPPRWTDLIAGAGCAAAWTAAATAAGAWWFRRSDVLC